VVYLPDDLSKQDAKKIAGLVDRDGVSAHYVKRASMFRKAEAAAALLKLVGSRTHNLNAAESERDLAIAAVDCLAQRLKLLQDADSHGAYEVRLGSLESFMKLDSAAVEAINLLPKADQPSQYGSIHGVLNRCRTKVGARLLDRWLRQPLVDSTAINQRLDLVETLKNSAVARNRLVDGPLKGVPDLDLVVDRMQRKNGGLGEVYRLYLFSKSLPSFVSVLCDLADGSESSEIAATIRVKFIEPPEATAAKFGMFQRLVEHVVDFSK